MSRMGACGWLITLVFMLKTFQSEASVPITLLENAVERGAVCLDGSPPAYHLDRGFGSGINGWLVHLEVVSRERSAFAYGGGWCHNVSHCLGRKTYHLGSSKYMPKQIHFAAILSGGKVHNPYFYNWNRVEVRYCDGSSFTGDVERVDPATKLYYRGARVWLAVMEDLLSKGMNASENAILTGGSAGGLAAILQCDSFRALLPFGTKVKCVSDAGYFVNLNDIMGKPHIRSYFDEIVALHGSAKNLPSSCTNRMAPSLCFFPQYLVEHIQTPLFVVNSAYDSWQIKNVLAPADDDPMNEWGVCKTNMTLCSPKQLEKMQDFRLKFVDALAGLTKSLSNGWFINSCYIHLQSELENIWFSPDSSTLAHTTIAVAVGGWFYDEHPFQQIDCPYPCKYSTCA